MRPKWAFVYYTGENLVVRQPDTVFESTEWRGKQDANFSFRNELFSKYSYFWHFDDFAGVVVPINICEIYTTHMGIQRQDIFSILMQIVYPEYVKSPIQFDQGLYDYVERHCVRIPIDEAAKEAAKTVYSPHTFVPTKYLTTQGRDLDEGNITITEIVLDVSTLTFYSGPAQFNDIAISVKSIRMQQLMFVPPGAPTALDYTTQFGVVPAQEPASADQREEVRAHIQESEGTADAEICKAGPRVLLSSPPSDVNRARDIYINAGVNIKFDITDMTALDLNTMNWGDRYVTDNIIHTLLAMTSPLRTYDAKHDDLFVMNSFFMKQLMLNTSAMHVREIAAGNFAERLTQWALRADGTYLLSDKSVIIVPYNYDNAHWLLYVIHKPYDSECRSPLVYVFDSSSSIVSSRVHHMNVKGICTYLDEAFKFHHRDRQHEPVSDLRGFRIAKVPQQGNGWACGWYTFLFARELIRSRESRESILTAAAKNEPVLQSITSKVFEVYRTAICKRMSETFDSRPVEHKPLI